MGKIRGKAAAAALAACALTAAASPAGAVVLVFDDFESYGPTSVLNFNGFANLTVTTGTVDYVHEPEYGLSTPYGTGMVDMDGSTGDPGILRTATFAHAEGAKLRFEFDASGNQRGGAADQWRFGFVGSAVPYTLTDFYVDFGAGIVNLAGTVTAGGNQSIFVNLPTLASGSPWTHYVIGATLINGPATLGGFIADEINPDAGDNLGPLVDNVKFSATVPEPSTWAVMILGFGLAGAGLRRRRVAVA